MSKILVVEPRKILQQALHLALCTDHEIQLESNPLDLDSAAIKNFDLVIVDAAALRQANVPSGQVLRAVQAWKIPKIWIDEPEGAQALSRDTFKVLIKPIEKETLQAAMATCLEATLSSERNGSNGLTAKETIGSTRMTGSDSASPAEVSIIDLVDVVEEPPARNRHSQRQRKTR